MIVTTDTPRGSWLPMTGDGRSLRLLPGLGAAALLFALSGCGPEYDPLTREGLWHPEHANRENLSLQVANPSDLVRGTGTVSSDGQLASAAVDRLRSDKVKKLPAADISQLSVGSSGSNNSGGSGAP